VARIGFVGLGVMGGPMASHLVRHGHDVTVFNRSAAKAEAWQAKHGGAVAASPAEAAAAADFFVLCVGRDDDVRSVILGADGALAALPAGAVIVDHTTTSAGLARQMHDIARARGIGFLDAPISGGQAGAEAGRLGVMVGGDPADFLKAEAMINCYGGTVGLMGPPGSGQLTKMVNQIMVVGLVEGLAEGLRFAEIAGLDLERVMSVLTQGAGRSWLMENRWRTMSERKFDFGFTVDLMRKDLAICLAEAARNGALLPATALIDGFYAEVQAMGGGGWDNSSLIARLDRDPGESSP
jgi:3-hydroxyisobutyrate dehydrogenase